MDEDYLTKDRSYRDITKMKQQKSLTANFSVVSGKTRQIMRFRLLHRYTQLGKKCVI